MITPKFNVQQTEKQVIIAVSAPHSNAKEFDVQIEKCDFLFLSPPYFLRLTFPGELAQKEYKSALSDAGEFKFMYDKQKSGEDFLSKAPVVNTLSEDEDTDIMLNSMQNMSLAEMSDATDTNYGFAFLGNQQFEALYDEFKEVFDINPFKVKLEDRAEARFKLEESKFDPDHYIADFMDRDGVDEIIKQTLPLDGYDQISEEEQNFLDELGSKVYDLSISQLEKCHYNLIDILYAYCYDRRTTCFEGTVESSWTISNISATLSSFAIFNSAKEALTSGFRRSVIYPLYRNFSLCAKVLEDLKKLLSLGDKCITKCLIEIYKMYEEHSERYILNDLYIRDYLLLMSSCDTKLFEAVMKETMSTKIEKPDVNLNLLKIEADVEEWARRNISGYESESSDDTLLSSSCSESSSSGSDTES